MAAAGRCCVLDIDVQGARLVRRSGLRAVFVFVAPPSSEELERRLRGRGTESEEQIAERLATAKQEITRRATSTGAPGCLLIGHMALWIQATAFVDTSHPHSHGKVGRLIVFACPRACRDD